MKRLTSPMKCEGDDRGIASLAAVVCVLVVVTLTSVAIQQSMAGLSGFAQGRKQLQTVDAAEAGLQSEINALQHWLSSPSGPLPCPGGGDVAGLPAGQGWVAASSNTADSVVDAASLGYYTLSLATYLSPPSGPTELGPSAACLTNSISAPTGISWYAVIQAKGVTSGTTGGSTATGRTLQALLHFGTISSNASARIYKVDQLLVPPSTVPPNPSATTASYSGSGPPDSDVKHSAQPSATLLNGETWLTAGALSQYAEADSTGSSQSCAGLVASPGAFQVGSPTCSTSGSPGGTGVTLDLSTIPVIGSVLSSIADVTLETSVISSSASMGVGGSPASGAAAFGTLYVQVKLPLGTPVTISVPVANSPNQDLMGAVTSAISGDSTVIGPITSTLVSTLSSTLVLTSNYQPPMAGGVFSVSAIHISAVGKSATGDIALSTVGPDTPPNTLSVVWNRQVA